MIGLLFLLTATLLRAEHSHISVNVDGINYFCGVGGGSGNNSVSQKCIQEVTNYCDLITTYGPDQCFTVANASCRGVGANYSNCVQESTNYCNLKTNLGANQCFDNSIKSCRGNFSGIREMIESASEKAVRLEKLSNRK